MSQVIKVLFTFATDCYTVEYSDGARFTTTYAGLVTKFGEREASRLSSIASKLTGHWHNVEAGYWRY